MSQSIVAVVAAVALSMAPVVARAGCANDMDCKGDRICDPNGFCVDPQPSAAPSTTAPSTREGYQGGYKRVERPRKTKKEERHRGDPGWNRGAAIMGIVSSIFILGFGSAAIAFNENIEVDGDDVNVPALATGGIATLVGMILIPIAGAGANSGTQNGPAALRVAGWIGYGLFMVNALALLGLGAATDVDVGSGPIAGTVVLGMLSSVSFTISGFVGHSRSASYASREQPVVLPVASSVQTPGGSRRPTIGLALRF